MIASRYFSIIAISNLVLACCAFSGLRVCAQQGAETNSYPALKAGFNQPASEVSSSSRLSAVPGDFVEWDLNESETNKEPLRSVPYGNHRDYSDKMHNADGSSRIAIALGGGLAIPAGNSRNVFTAGYALKGSVGYNFSNKLGIMAEVGYDHFGLQGSVITAQQNYYNSLNIIDPNTGALADFSGLDANAHVWSLTLDPIYTLYQGESFGAYVIGGGGYYHKAVNFTLPQSGYYCDEYDGCYPVVQNANFDTHSANGGGVNGGAGLTFRPSRFGSLKFFTEMRYVWTNTKLTLEQAGPSPISMLDKGTNSYIPVTFGVRW